MKRVLKLIFMARDSLHCKNIKEKKKLLPGDRIKSSAMKFTVFPSFDETIPRINQQKSCKSYPIEHQVSALPSVLSTELRYARKAS
jgi:hypothetical protein